MKKPIYTKNHVGHIMLTALLSCVSPVVGQQNAADVFADPTVNIKRPEGRAKAVAKIKAIEEKRAARTRAKAKVKGLMMRIKKPGGGVMEIVDFDGDKPIYLTTLNVDAAISTSANLVQVSPYLLDGTGMIAGVWDGGAVRSTHQEFTNGNRVTIMDGAAFDDHATHVAGTIGARGANASAKGMASNIAIHSYDWGSDFSEMTSRAATAPNQFGTHIYFSNHSYGYANGWNGNEWLGNGTDQNAADHSYGQYDGTARDLDSVAYGSPYYLMFWGAGNELDDKPYLGETVKIGDVFVSYDPSIHPPGDGEYRNGFECIGSHGLAKNVITVGAARDAVTSGLRDPAKATLTYFSATGPTDDGRIKPDLVANGWGLTSSVSSGDAAYDNYDGTSMASPNATGSAALVIDQYKRLFNSAMRSSTLKGLLIHTATDLGNPGPDYKYGWGLVDTKKAVDLVRDHHAFPVKSRIIEDQVSSSITTRTHTFQWDGTSPLSATACWTDPAGTATSAHDSRASTLVNNLNLKLIAPNGTEYFPYVMPFVGTWTVASMNQNATTGINNTDNVETVLIPSPGQTGTWQAVVSYSGALTSGSQAYGLILSGTANTPNTVIVNSPNGGESIARNSSYPITWASNVSGNVSIDLLKAGVFHSVISANEVNDGSFTWTAPLSLPLASDYSIRISSVNNSAFTDTSAATFSITPFIPTGSGSITREVWTGISGTSVADIPTGNAPNISDSLTSLEGPSDWEENYGTRIRGYITAPSTGSYTFWIASDDDGQLWLSTNNQPSSKVKIAEVLGATGSREWNAFSSQKSATINLTAGNQYYVEVLQKEGGGGDNVAVGWAKPGEPTTAPSQVIPGIQLSPYDQAPPIISSFNPADNATGVALGANLVATFSENIAIGTGNITLKNLTDATQTTIAVTDTTQVSVSGAVLTIDPAANLIGSKNYAVQIAATAITDTSSMSFAGITNDTTWNFATVAPPDTTPPTPNPMTFASLPSAVGSTSITMTATTASDASSVQYYFTETSGNPGGSDSGWQSSPIYTDSGLSPITSYTYRVKARDTSSNETTASAPASATTAPAPIATSVWNVNVGNEITTSDNFAGAAAENSTPNSFWNSFTTTPTNLALKNATNGTTSATLTMSAAAGLGFGNVNLTSGPEIFSSWTNGNSNSVFTMTLGGLSTTPGVTYDLILYSDWWWNDGENLPVTQTAGTGLTGTVYLNHIKTGSIGIVPGLVQDTALGESDSTQGNWIRISGLIPNASGVLSFNLGGQNAGLSGFQLVQFGGSDTTPPTLATLNPADNATGVALGANLVATFSENIAIGTGNITLKNLTDATQTTIAVTDASQVSVSGTTLTINPTANLMGSKNYAVQIAATAVKDAANNNFAGITNDTAWNFGTLPSSQVAFTFYRFTSTRLRDDAGANSIQLSEFEFALGASVVNLSAATITNPAGSSPGGEGITNIGDGNTNTKWLDFNRNPIVFQFTAPTAIDSYRFATANDESGRDPISWKLEGSENGTSWTLLDERNLEPVTTDRFTYTPWYVIPAGDTTPPAISSFNPADNATGVAISANLVATFSENIAIGTGSITIKNLTDATQTSITLPDAQVTVSGANLTINPTANLAKGKNYAIHIANTAVKDLANNAFAGIANDTTWNFATVANAVPVANAQSVSTAEDTAKAITLTATDADGDPLTYTVLTQPANGTLSGTAPNLTFTPGANFNGSTSFTFRANDGLANSNTATVTITVTAVNDAPIATAQSVTTNQNTAKAITLAGTDVENSSLTYTIAAQPTNGTLSGTAPNLTYTPNANYSGSDSFTFTVNDGSVNSAPATVTITILGGNIWIYNGTDATGNTWTTATSWSGGVIANGANATANFILDITAARTITLGANRTIGNIIFTDTTSSHDLTLSGNALTMDVSTGSPAINVTQADRQLIIASILAGTKGLEKNGTGTLVLSGGNTHTGTTTISAGTLRLEGNAFSTTARNYAISSGAILHQAGNSQIPTGTTTISGAGTLRASFANGIGSGRTLNISLGSGGMFEVPSGASIYNGGWQAINWSGNQATINLNGSLNIADGQAITAAALTGTGTFDSTVNGGSAANITLGAANGTGTFSGNITAAGTRVISLVKTGTGTQAFSGNVTYRGKTTINGGTLRFGTPNSLYAAATANWVKTKIAVNTGGTIAFNVGGTNEFTTSNITTLLSGLGGAVNNNGLRAGSTLAFDTTNASGGTFAITNLLANTTGTGGGAIGLTKLGSGTLEISANNTYTGATTISAGTLRINGNQSSASGNVTVAATGTLGGTGTIGGNTTIASGGGLAFNISTPAASHDRLDISTGRTLTFSGSSVLTITSSGGAATGTYTLITGGNNITGAAPATLNLPAGWAATVSISGNSLQLNVTSTTLPLAQANQAAFAASSGGTSDHPDMASTSPTGSTSGESTTEQTTNTATLPLPWTATDIGTGMLAGTTQHTAGTFIQSGSGTIGSTSDKLRFTYQTLTGDSEIIAKISNVQNSGNTARVGVMIRDSLAANAKQSFIGMNNSTTYRWDSRTATGGSTTTNSSSTGTVFNTWVRLVRSGTTITAHTSADGTNWTKVSTTKNTTLAPTCYIGLAISSGSDTTLTSSQFSNVKVIP